MRPRAATRRHTRRRRREARDAPADHCRNPNFVSRVLKFNVAFGLRRVPPFRAAPRWNPQRRFRDGRSPISKIRRAKSGRR
ncbi:hypothetical protein EVAR_9359_1 [Eumeta japonica]|uniref:Uncharacterized protein n=1 Tax=Eumeta variegata TaxID=151549 RepID=A0A4C1YPF9_EUMVA|nr:hypothetical protein EVAR_9359_1 [Eumeta japonica]